MAFTEQQSEAIAARGKVLVSASAGAGKTTVMIKRLADILSEGASLDNVLAVTFTNKAAAQMKEKLRSELVSRLSDEDEAKRENIRVQLGKINSADISTIHAFCARLVRTYFYALDGVDASFELAANDAEVGEMRTRAMDNLFDKLYGKGDGKADEDFLYLVDRLKKRRSDSSVREVILQAYDRLRIEPGYKNITARTARTFSDGGFEEVCRRLGELIGERCAYYSEKVKKFGSTLAFASNGAAYAAVLGEMCESLDYVAEKKDLFDRPLRLNSTSKPRVRAENAAEDERFAKFFNNLKRLYTNLFKDVKSPEEERVAFNESGRLAAAFANVLLLFDEEYTAIKRDEGKLDYGDLEHLAYSLVCAEGSVDNDVKEQINGKYKFVFVDEYQDVNPIQDAIINAVAGNDLFKVGDVKQAIYGFRGSRSHFFAQQLKVAAEEGTSVILPHNFRSLPAVVDCVNELFSGVMAPAVCGFDYAKEDHAMISGKGDLTEDGVAEIRTFESGKADTGVAEGIYSIVDELPENAPPTAESYAIINLIDELLQSEIYDAEQKRTRRVQQGDICVLTRKKNKKSIAEAERALLSKGYRVDGAAEANVCDFADIKNILNILSYIDNGEQDVALAAALLSPLGNMTEDELAAIRLHGGVGKGAPPFRRCAEIYPKEVEDGIARKLGCFYGKISRLRRLSEGIGAARLIDEVVSEGGFVARYADEAKLSNLRRLQKEAYSPSGELSLNAFLSKLKAADYKVNTPLPPSSDSIKIMTMHASKGLEFPVVIISDIAAGFSGDERNEMPYDEEFGFAPRYYDSANRVYGGTLLRKLCRMRSDAEELKNEINLFYVACTRAKSNLYLLCGGDKEYDASNVPTASCYADLFDANALKKVVKRGIYAGEQQNDEQFEGGKRVIGSFAVDEELYRELERTLGAMPCGERIQLPVKSSATKLLSLSADDEVHPVLFNEERAEGATGIDSGIAYHAYLQMCNFEVKDEAGVRAELAKLSAGGLITPRQYSVLDVNQLVKILSLPQFTDISGKETYREREFLCALPAEDYLSLTGTSAQAVADAQPVIIQGAIDLLVVERQEGRAVAAHVVDYKYSSRADEVLKEKYGAQLALYKTAVARIYGLKREQVKTTIINIRACSAIELEV